VFRKKAAVDSSPDYKKHNKYKVERTEEDLGLESIT